MIKGFDIAVFNTVLLPNAQILLKSADCNPNLVVEKSLTISRTVMQAEVEVDR